MIARLKVRLSELQEEFGRGQKKLGELDAESTSLRQAMLRISGAIQVLREELEKEETGGGVTP